jgi:hypothetical protein
MSGDPFKHAALAKRLAAEEEARKAKVRAVIMAGRQPSPPPTQKPFKN